jgi:SAM-dependent methyltransferase
MEPVATPDVEPGTADYWDHRYATIGDTQVSWFQDQPVTSLSVIGKVAGPSASVVDVGGGASRLVDHLLELGYRDLTVVDLSQEALRASHDRIGEAPVTWIASDIREWQPARAFDVWHDRAAYHFLTDPDDQQRYWQLVRDSVVPGGHVVIATFAEDGPESCSGLPVVRYGAEQLREVMGDGFVVLESMPEQHVTPTGGTQSFQWTVAQRS